MRALACLFILACILACDLGNPKAPSPGPDGKWGDTSKTVAPKPYAIPNGLYRRDEGITPNPAGGPALGPSYEYLEIHNSRAKHVGAGKNRFGWDSVVCYHNVEQNKDSILLLQPDAKQDDRCETTHAQYAVYQDKDSIGVLKMTVYSKDPGGKPGLWRTEKIVSPVGTSYLLLEKDSISFHTLETKYPYRASGDSLYYTTQYGEYSILVKYFEGLLLTGNANPVWYQKK